MFTLGIITFHCEILSNSVHCSVYEFSPYTYLFHYFSSVQFSRSVVSDSATPWTAARQASLSITNSWTWVGDVHWVGDAVKPSHPLSSPSPPALSQHQGLFKRVSSSHQVAKVLELQLHKNVMRLNCPKTIPPASSPWKNCLPQNQSQLSKKVGDH